MMTELTGPPDAAATQPDSATPKGVSSTSSEPAPAIGAVPKRFRRGHLIVLAALGLVPLVLVVGKRPELPTAEWLNDYTSLAQFSPSVQKKAYRVLFMPIAAIAVVVARLPLGLRMLGPFRSILLALAFETTGILPGVAFFAVTVAITVAARPAIHSMDLPYFGSVTVTMSAVAVIMTIFVFLGGWLHMETLQNIAYLPIVVLCLVSEAVDRTIDEEGVPSAIARTMVTVGIAVLLALFAGFAGLRDVLLRFPELLLTQTAAIVLIARYCDWRLLEWMNPYVPVEGDKGDKVVPAPIPK